ncbi:nuclear transport factor 2 family protein [Dermatobacter hominis]|uniref:nuclear transport factor 2 family protein n=1 Tax=Dermatobacter hominis TaxID=2884263 RepID=UPI001D0FDF35|nr:nuclear transport factor 2 family protein [Dermatobacter hominis]UDY34910.1 nuclear transport factor 2 family protein [Dermatobacter hominis]
MASSDISFAEAEELVGRWWFLYDEGRIESFEAIFTSDAVFTVGVDDPTVAWAEFATAEASGRDAIVAWQTEHRLDSPAPLRHHSSNFHRTGTDGDGVTFASYILVNHVVDEMPAMLPSGVVTGTVRREDGELKIARLDVVLDTRASTPLREQR